MLRSPEPGSAGRARVLIIGCGALARELVGLVRDLPLDHVDVTCLPAALHNRPDQIPAAVRGRIRAARAAYDRIFVAYADCGTGGLLDRMIEEEGVQRLAGAHCYEVYAGRAQFGRLSEEEPGTFYLTDFLVRNFDRLVISGLGLDRHPELRPLYFGNYRRVVYLAQIDDPALTAAAERAADQLGLAFERRVVGLGELAPAITAFVAASPGAAAVASHAHIGRLDPAREALGVDSLHDVHDPDRTDPFQAVSLHPAQRHAGAARRRPVPSVHPMQRPARHVRQMKRRDRRRSAPASRAAISPAAIEAA